MTGRIPRQGTAKLAAGGLPVTVAPGRGTDTAAGQVQVQVLGQHQSGAAGIKGVLLTASATEPGSAQVSVDYSAFASAFGGDWSGRLQLVRLPSCVLTTPDKAACRTQIPLGSRNNIGAQTLSAMVSLGQASSGTGTARASRSAPRTSLAAAVTNSSATVLAVTAASSGESASGAGNYAASPLSASSSWEAGSSSGAFTWDYPLTTPPAAAGPAPQLSLSYNSGSVDGRTASTNNQGTLVGEGFDLTSSYIERSYASCDDDGEDGKHDLCWKYDNASLVLNGKSTELVKDDTTGAWHLKDDDASTVTHSTGADNGDNDGEYWTVTAGDGTKYIFGLNKLPGADTQRTNSVWTAPVFGNNSGEPGYDQGSTYADRAVTQAWRWNLDYVVDLHGNAMSYWYTAETNYYGKNGATTGTAQYTRGGYPTKILYGQNKDTLFTGTATDEVTFSYDERCTASDCSSLTSSTASNWPDVPFDAICTSGADCKANGPAFFTRKRLTSIDTHAWSAATSAYTDVDSWALTQQFLDPGDIGNSTDQSLVLKTIQHTGKNGTAITLDPVTFTYQMRANRVDSSTDNILPLNRPRIASITSETGAVTNVTLSNPECARGSNMPSSEDNDTMSCYPVYWHINGATEASLDWFNKYRVTDVITCDPTGLGETMENHYSYSGPAWHYNNDPITPAKERTWSQWRGYRTVTTLKGASSETQSKTVSLYLQGMDGDKQKDGTTRSISVPGISFTGLSVADQTDSDRFSGFNREQITYNGSTPVSVTVNYPWSHLTASQQKSYANIEAYFIRTYKTETSTYLTTSSSWRTHSVNTSFDSYGMPVSVNDSGQLGLSGDETCTRTWYARNDSLGINALISRTRVVGRVCSTAETDLNLPASSSTRGDLLSDTATVYDDPNATAWTASQTPTLGDVSWTGRASAYPATATNGERYPTSWQTGAKTTYDTLGRPLTVTDAAGYTTTTVYTPLTTGPLTKTTVTNAKNQKSYTYLDYARGAPTKVYDVNNKLTESTYDALGRVTAVWLPNHLRAAGYGANYTYAYSVTNNAPSWTSTSSILGEGVYNTTYAIYDSLLRPLQTQSPTANGGRLLTDTRYDSRGLAYETYADVFDSSATPSGNYARAEYGGAPKQTDTAFDGAERPTNSTFYVYGVMKRFTSTTYTGDSTATTAPAGGSAVRAITDIFGRTTEQREYAGTDPADTAYGAGVGAPYTSTKYTYTRDSKPATVTGPDSTKWSYTYDLFGRQISSTDPDKGTTTTSYTDLDQVATTTDSRNTTLLYGYDELGRKTDEWQTSKTDANKLANWAYDTLAKGQLDSSTSYVGGVAGTAYTRKVTTYDSLYRPTTTQLVLPSTDALVTSGAVTSTLTFSTYYNLDGTQQYISEPAAAGLAAEKVVTHYNSVGLPTDVTGLSGYLLGAAYSEIGEPQQFTLGTSSAAGTKKAYITNTWEEGTDRLKQSAVTDQTHAYELQELNYGYDDAGNVTAITDPTTLGGTGKVDDQCFSYDGHQRLTEAWTPSTADCSASGRTSSNLGGAAPYWTSYAYTDSGLRTTETTHTSAGDTTKTYCYDASRPHTLTATTTASSCIGVAAAYTYDNAGNTTSRPNGSDTQSLTWNPEGQLDTLTEKSSSGATKSTTRHVYDADGSLLIRRNTSGETVLYLDDMTEVHLDTSTSTAKYWAQRYYTAAGSTIALRSNQTGTEALSWLAGDGHGTSSLAITGDTTQAVTKRYTTPFGAARTGATGNWPDDKTFLGKSADRTTGLTYIGAREYDPTTGRFISVDPVLNASDAQSLNGYTYADNNPATQSDPTGLCPVDLCGGGEGKGGSTTGEVTKVDKSSPVYQDLPYDHVVPGTGKRQIFPGVYIKAQFPGWQKVRDRFYDLWLGTANTNFYTPQYLQDPQDPNQQAQVQHWLWMACKGGTVCPKGTTSSFMQDVAGLISSYGLIGEGSRGGLREESGRGGRESFCSFSPDTKVLMGNGKTKPIGKIKVGDRVQAANPKTGRHQGARAVQHVWINHDHDLIDLTIRTKDGHTATVHTTANHPFWDDTTHTWVPAGRLRHGNALNTAINGHAYVVSTHPTPGLADRWNLTIQQLHTYYVLAGETPVLVHNSGGCIPWSSGSVSRASKSLADGATSVTVKSRSEAEELFLRTYQGDGYRNASGMDGVGTKQYYGTKRGTYHWDDQLGEDGRVLGHGAGNRDGDLPHLQVHTFDGPIVRIFWEP
ncbi:RHS repeat-associated core domain-containing protein [Streptomyces sp. NPDC002076]